MLTELCKNNDLVLAQKCKNSCNTQSCNTKCYHLKISFTFQGCYVVK